jgi:hypothetical protein
MHVQITSPILITGCARSGTSMTAGIIHACGAFGGKLAGPNLNNQKGMFENVAIRNGLVKKYLRSIGADHLGQHPLPDQDLVRRTITPARIMEFQKYFYNIFKDDGYDFKSPMFYKGAKLCLIWPLIHSAFPDARWIIVRRTSKDIVRSCLKTGFMRAYTHELGWYKWVDYHLERFLEMQYAGLNVYFFWPERICDDGIWEEAEALSDHLDLEYNEDAVKEFVEPTLWHKAS